MVRRPPPRWYTPYLLAVFTALVFSLAFPPFEISWVAYFALAPLIVMAVRTRRDRHVFAASYLGGVVFFGLNMHWLWQFHPAGFIALMLYLALAWPLFAWGSRRIGRAVHLPMVAVAPAVWVALEVFRGWALTGLPWLFAGHTQYENLVLIQTADALGVYGASFLVVMTNALVADLLTRPLLVPQGKGEKGRLSLSAVAGVAAVVAAWAGTVGYGFWRLGQETTRPGPTVLAVQTSIPQEIKLQARYEDFLKAEERMMDDLVRLTREGLADAKEQDLAVDLVVWPETMVPGFINEGFLAADFPAAVEEVPELAEHLAMTRLRYRKYWQRVREMAREAGAPVLCGATAAWVVGVEHLPGGRVMARLKRSNRAYLIGTDSEPYEAEHTYDKVHLVPFGEYVPFRETFPPLYRVLLGMTPYPYDYSLTAGSRNQAPFVLEKVGGARFLTPICYEDAFAYRIRDMVRLRPSAASASQGYGGQVRPESEAAGAPRAAGREPSGSGGGEAKKGAQFIVNISNDGWFVRAVHESAAGDAVETDAEPTEVDHLVETVQHKQHLNLCVFRAIENRVPVVRSVNTGISGRIASSGRIEEVVRDPAGEGRCVEGYALGRIELDARVTPYTRIGDLFALLCVAGALAGAAWAVVWRVLTGQRG